MAGDGEPSDRDRSDSTGASAPDRPDSSEESDPDRRPAGSGRSPTGSVPDGPGPRVDHTSGYGLTLTLLGGVLLALAYYGAVAIRSTRTIGQALPEPFYGLAIALLFVVELLNSRHRGPIALGRALAFAAVYGALLVFAVEGGAYLWEHPEVALENYEGVTVLAVALVAAALLYVGYLTVVERGSR